MTVDPTRLGKDSSGLFDKLVSSFPAPNNFDIGDGFNTAGVRFLSTDPFTQDMMVIKGDYVLTSKHRLSVSYSRSRLNSPGSYLLSNVRSSLSKQTYPTYILSVNSTFTPHFLNEFRVGSIQIGSKSDNGDPARYKPEGIVVFAGLASSNTPQRGHPKSIYLPQYSARAMITINNNATWIRDNHSLRGGVEIRISRVNTGYSGDYYFAVIDTRNASNPANIPALPGLNSADRTRAAYLTNDLTGSIGRIQQDFQANTPSAYTPFEMKFRHYRSKEYSSFFQDTWKVRPNLTLNLGRTL